MFLLCFIVCFVLVGGEYGGYINISKEFGKKILGSIFRLVISWVVFVYRFLFIGEFWGKCCWILGFFVLIFWVEFRFFCM